MMPIHLAAKKIKKLHSWRGIDNNSRVKPGHSRRSLKNLFLKSLKVNWKWRDIYVILKQIVDVG